MIGFITIDSTKVPPYVRLYGNKETLNQKALDR